MAQADGLYSRVIAWLKVVLPLVALALLSTLFLLAQDTEPTMSLPFADAGAGGGTGEQVGQPYFAGSTERGDLLTMTASRARPEAAGVIHADHVAASLTLTDGSRIDMQAGSARLTDADKQAVMQGGVSVYSSAGYDLATDAMRAALDRVDAESLGPVVGVGPPGRLEAGKLTIRGQGEDGGVQLLFTGGVKLVYLPQS